MSVSWTLKPVLCCIQRMGQISDDHEILCVHNSRVEFGFQELWEPPEIIHKTVYIDTYVNFVGREFLDLQISYLNLLVVHSWIILDFKSLILFSAVSVILFRAFKKYQWLYASFPRFAVDFYHIFLLGSLIMDVFLHLSFWWFQYN